MKITEKDIGRKVIVNSINSGTINFNNRIGILKAIDDSFQWGYGIIFDKYIDVGHNLAGLCDYGYGYWVYKEDITFISPPNGFLEYFKNNNVVVNCETEQEAEWFCEWMHDNGMKWAAGNSYKDYINWNNYKENTCYCSNNTYQEIQYFKEEKYEIIKWKDLMNWEEDTMKETFEVGDEVELIMNYYDEAWSGNNTHYKCGDRFIIKSIEESCLSVAGQGWLCDNTGNGVFASICKIVNKAKNTEEENNRMDYKVVKTFTLKDILEKDPCSEEFDNLVDELIEQDGYNFRAICKGNIHFNENNWKEYDTFQNNLDWLEEKGFIEKVKTFEPFDLTFRIESKEELGEIYHVLNCPYNKLKEYLDEFPEYKKYPNNEIKRGKLFEIVQKEMYRIKD